MGEKGLRILENAVEAYERALTVRTREHLSQQWAATQNNLGSALARQGMRLGGKEGTQLLRQAIEAYEQALTVRAREHLPQGWSRTQNNLAGTYFLLEDWANAASCYANLLTLYPDDETAYQRLTFINHEHLFRFSEAFELNRRRVELHPDDLPAQCDFAEKHFTTARFAECEKRIATLLANPKVDARNKVALGSIEIANLLALGKVDLVQARIDGLIQVLASLQAHFNLARRFIGTQHFIRQHDKLAPYRDWLRQFFSALQAENREAMIKDLRDAGIRFSP